MLQSGTTSAMLIDVAADASVNHVCFAFIAVAQLLTVYNDSAHHV
jgi:hypothetical protein